MGFDIGSVCGMAQHLAGEGVFAHVSLPDERGQYFGTSHPVSQWRAQGYQRAASGRADAGRGAAAEGWNEKFGEVAGS